MINGGPYTITLGGVVDVPNNNGQTPSGNPPVAVQVVNSSGFFLNCATDGLVFSVPSFTAMTLDSASGTNLVVTAVGGVTTTANNFTVTWLNANEQSPLPDGPLTAAAIFAALTVTATTTQFLAAEAVPVLAGQTQLVVEFATLIFPNGTTLDNYNSAYVVVYGPSEVTVDVILLGSTVAETYFQAQHALLAAYYGSNWILPVILPLALGSSGGGVSGIVVIAGSAAGVSVDVVLTQEVLPQLGPLVY